MRRDSLQRHLECIPSVVFACYLLFQSVAVWQLDADLPRIEFGEARLDFDPRPGSPESLRSLVGRNLFSPIKQEVHSAVQPQLEAHRPAQKLTLVGTLVSRGRSIALIRQEGRRELLRVGPGDRAGNWLVERVTAAQVRLFSESGHELTIRLYQRRTPGKD